MRQWRFSLPSAWKWTRGGCGVSPRAPRIRKPAVFAKTIAMRLAPHAGTYVPRETAGFVRELLEGVARGGKKMRHCQNNLFLCKLPCLFGVPVILDSYF